VGNFEWFFPENSQGGQPEGLNDSGVESFRGNQIESLARETIQNSTDARKDKSKPVTVSFNKFEYNAREFPDKEGLLKAFESCKIYKRTPKQAQQFFEKGAAILRKESIQFLKVSDYNTTGLQGINQEASDWENLVKSVGISNKGGSAGGSFGIGKSAPFACSSLRTVFYSTLNLEGEIGFQGVSRLASHERERNETRGTGFYGIRDNTQPITNLQEMPSLFDRSEPGTDVIVAGFINDENWKRKIITAVIENFFMAIHEEKLVVKVADVIIQKSTLKALTDKYILPQSNLFANEYYSAIIFGEKKEHEIEGLGEIILYVKRDDEFSKKVAMVRNTGMKITHMDRFRGGTKFSGVLLIQGQKLNEILRKTEPPAHDKWEPSRFEEDPGLAEKLIKEIKEFVRSSIKEMNTSIESNKIDFKGFNKFLPDHLNEEDSLENDNLDEDSNTIPKSMKISMRKNKQQQRSQVAGKKKKKKISNPEAKKKKKRTTKPTSKTSTINLTKIRSIVVSETQGTYDLKIKTSNSGQGKLLINFIGEDAKSYKANVLNAVNQNSNTEISCNNEGIGPIKFVEHETVVIRVQLKEKIRASLEVLVNAD
jgi:hypothetical protein